MAGLRSVLISATVALSVLAGCLSIAEGVANVVLFGAHWRPISICLVGIIAGIVILSEQASWIYIQKRNKSHKNATHDQQLTQPAQAAHGYAYVLLAVLLTDWPLPLHQQWLFWLSLMLAACGAFRLLLLLWVMLLPKQHSAMPLDTEEKLAEHHQFTSPSIPRTSGATADPMHDLIISRHAPTASFGQLSVTSLASVPTKPVDADGSEHFVFSALAVEEQSPVKEFKDEGIRAILEAATKSDARSMKRPRGTRMFSGAASPEAGSVSKPSPSAVPRSLPPSPEHSPRALPALPIASPRQVAQVSPKAPSLSPLPPLSDGRFLDNPHTDARASLSDFARKRSKRQSVSLPGIGALELSSDSESDYDDDDDAHDSEEEAAGSLLGNPNTEAPTTPLSASGRSSKRNSAARRHEKETRAIKRELSQGSADRERRLRLQAALEIA